jgi:DNA repair protein RadC
MLNSRWAENLPYYELLQIMLFTSNPHADVAGLAEELLDRFGSLAEVMSVDTEISLVVRVALSGRHGNVLT